MMGPMMRGSMTVWSRGIISVGAVLMVAVAACGGSQSTNQTSPGAIGSIHVSAQGANYIAAESRLLSGFAIGVGKGKITAGSRVAVSDSANGVKASGQVWYGKSLQTASGFNLDFNSTYTSQSGLKHVRGSGNLFVASTGSAPSLTAAVVAPGAGAVLAAGRWQPAQLAYAPATGGTAFDVGSETGGQVVFSGNQMTYTDQQGNVVGQHTFDAGDDLETHVKQVLNANVPPPNTNEVKQACQGDVTTVDNTEVFSLSVDDESSTGHISIISVLVTKHAQVDCKTNQATTFTRLDVSGEIDGKGFLALSSSPPAPDTTPPDSGPAPAEPALTNFSIGLADANLLPPALLPNGQLPTPTPTPKASFNGAYTGRIAINATPLAFSVSGNTITVTQPGAGSGSIDAGGNATFTADASAGLDFTVTCHFSGLLKTLADGTHFGGGPVTCVFPKGNDNGTWDAHTTP
jgi:hypothetical protein